MSNNTPENLKYAKSHEWVKDNQDGTVTVGITDHAQDLLGDIVFVELPETEPEPEQAPEGELIELNYHSEIVKFVEDNTDAQALGNGNIIIYVKRNGGYSYDDDEKTITLELVNSNDDSMNGTTFFRNQEKFITFLKNNFKEMLKFEFIFLFSFLAFAIIRSFNPDLWHPFRGGEKPMEISYLSALLNSKNLPPFDPWFSGATMNYYYYHSYLKHSCC